MSASGQEDLLEVREASRMSWCDRETLPNVPDGLEALLDVRQLSKALRLSGSGRRPSQKFGSDWETLPVVR